MLLRLRNICCLAVTHHCDDILFAINKYFKFKIKSLPLRPEVVAKKGHKNGGSLLGVKYPKYKNSTTYS